MTDAHLPWWGRAYIFGVALAGMLILGHSVYVLYSEPISWNWFVLAILTLVTGSATVKLPSVPATISVSETFVFTSALLYGPAAGTLTVALDALAISLSLARKGHPWYRIVFNIFALPASLWVGAQAFFWSAGLPPLSALPKDAAVDLGGLLKPLVIFAACYFGLNSSLIALAISTERKLSPLRVWRENFAWLSLNYFGGASVAALLVTYTREFDYRLLAIVLPLLAVLYYTFSNSMGRIADTNRHLSELNSLYMSTIETLAMAIDAKDQITHGHIRRVQHYAVELAKAIGIRDPAHIRAIEAASLLHDMGKLAVPEYILNKPGPLTPAEFEKMKLHASVGADILSSIDFPYPVVPIVRHHHENWDGGGYPDGIKGTDIPIGARILSVVDCFDALTSDRPYRPKLPDSEAIKILQERRGSMYDPLVVDTFLQIYSKLTPSVPSYVVPGKEGLSAITRSLSPSESSQSAARLIEINASTEEAVGLYDLATALSQSSDFDALAEITAKHVRRMVPASTCVLYLFDDRLDELYVAAAFGEHSGHFIDVRIPRGQRLTGWVAANGLSVRNSDPVLDLGDVARTVKPPLRSCLSAPMSVGSDLVGVLSVYSTQSASFSENHQRIVESVAKQVAATVRKTRRSRGRAPEDRSSDLKRIGPGAPSPAPETVGDAQISILVVEAIGWGGAVTVPWDEIQRALKGCLRPGDVMLKLSDRTMIVLLKRTPDQAALGIMQRSWRQLAQLDVSEIAGVTLTVGLAAAIDEAEPIESMIERARRGSVPIAAGQPPPIH